jgi:hypothetical protein
MTTLSIELLQEGKVAEAARVTTVSNTLKAEPSLVNKLAKILEQV